MADESGAAGVAKGLRRSLESQMWTGDRWVPVGELLALWLSGTATQGLSAADAQRVRVLLAGALALGPSVDQVERFGLG